MKQSSNMGFLFSIAGILSVLAFPCNPLIIFKVLEPNDIKVLWYIGWIFWAVGIALIIPSYYYIFFHKVKVLVDSGIYSIIRHPMYLGWILSIFVATIFLYQHWLFVIIAIPGIASVYLISRQEEHLNVERFGDDYKRYMQVVPRMNLLMGIIRLVRTKK
ncbi:MAG: isoprenylcysteine carboxylmethyltransferase family protein [Chloroflexi bacterium]|nr:isoprenylcysteine carboxylmethyltransferase family protein [Chloroflexota bacterium]